MEMAGLARSSDSIGETEMESLQFSGNKPRVSRLFLDAKGLLSAGLFTLAFSASYTHLQSSFDLRGENDFRKAFFSLVYFPFGRLRNSFRNKAGNLGREIEMKAGKLKGEVGFGS